MTTTTVDDAAIIQKIGSYNHISLRYGDELPVPFINVQNTSIWDTILYYSPPATHREYDNIDILTYIAQLDSDFAIVEAYPRSLCQDSDGDACRHRTYSYSDSAISYILR